MDKARLVARLEEYWVCLISTFHLLVLSIHGSNTRVDSISDMRTALVRLRDQLGSNSFYFEKVYKHTFDLARNEGQRSLGETSNSLVLNF